MFSPTLFLHVLGPAFVMALMNIISSLMLSLLVDPITGVPHKSNQQTISIGLGNIAAGMVGGIAGAASIVTLANLRSGGRFPVSSILSVSVLIAAVIGAGPLLGRVPFAVLAAILIQIGWNLIDRRFVARLHRISRGYVMVMVATTGLAVLVDFVSAILIGIALSSFYQRQKSGDFRVEAPDFRSTPGPGNPPRR